MAAMADGPIQLDVLIFGGGAAGLWLLDDLRRRGYQALLIERTALGDGQTVASQGIIHGGLKYTLDGIFNPAAEAIREMPVIWRSALAGENDELPDLRETRVRSPFCYLWRTGSLRSRFGMIGAKLALRVRPEAMDEADWPPILRDRAGEVLRLPEQVIDAPSFIACLAQQNRDRILHADATAGAVSIERSDATDHDAAGVRAITLPDPHRLTLAPRFIVLTAGAGNAALRLKLGLAAENMQRRPLHMVMVREREPGQGALPEFYGHCTDGAKTRVTITSAVDRHGRRVWQIGGQIAEEGVGKPRDALITHAQRELSEVVRLRNADALEWSTYAVDRAEAATAGGRRPDDAAILHDGNILTVWPTKLALAPRAAQRVLERVGMPAAPPLPPGFADSWPRPDVADPPWEKEREWIAARSAAQV
jgi:glycine/D-amino acid oxidase-like deaminating enzyme